MTKFTRIKQTEISLIHLLHESYRAMDDLFRNDFKKNKTVKLVTLSKIALPPPPLPEIVT